MVMRLTSPVFKLQDYIPDIIVSLLEPAYQSSTTFQLFSNYLACFIFLEPKPEPGFCLCKGSGLQGFKVYAKPDEISTTVSWPENELLKCNTKVLPKPVLISPAGSKSGGQFEVRSKPHKITYSYRYKNYDGEYVDFNCSVKFTVKGGWMIFNHINFQYLL